MSKIPGLITAILSAGIMSGTNYLSNLSLLAPEPTQSKPSFNMASDEEPDTPVKDPNPLAGLDSSLENAVRLAAKTLAAVLRLELQTVPKEGLEKAVTDGIRGKDFTRLLSDELLDNFVDYTEEQTARIKEQIQVHEETILNYVGHAVLKRAQKDKEPATSRYTQADREVINRVLKLSARTATGYEILDVKQKATTKEIISAYRAHILGIHPDHNVDPDAKYCAGVLIETKKMLCDHERRKVYDMWIKNTPRPPDMSTFEEEFAPNAFDTDSDNSGDDTSEVDSEFGELKYPKPEARVEDIHSRIGKHVKKFFEDLEGPIDEAGLRTTLSTNNKKIKKHNKKGNSPNIDIYTVPYDELLRYQYMQRSIAREFESKLLDDERAQRGMQSLRNVFERSRRRGVHQWPESWTEYILTPLRKKLETKLIKDTPMSDVKDDPSTPVYKELGILAHSGPPERSTRAWGYNRTKYFYDMEGPNKLRVKMIEEADKEKVSQYHESGRVQNIRYKEGEYWQLNPKDLIRIIGVAFLPGTGSHERTCWTYIRAEIRGVSDHDRIMTRSTLRNWLGAKIADRKVDDFLVFSKTTPPWAMNDNDSMEHESYPQLTYPLPKKSHEIGKVSLRRRNVDDDDYEDDSRHAVFRHKRRPDDIEELITRFDKITDVMNSLLEDSRQQRKQNNEIMKRFITSS
ncbi:hypothetical protein F5Y13DRAFT_204287 [Hypoxylon sp. FL1857]|nr:hypothetical protein F5Y13DRAFT_204287 [Hypoxylon sp. FL1857]